MNNLLIDTDVILDFFFDRKPYSDHASKLLSYCEVKEVNGFVTPVIVSNSYYILRRTAKHQKVIDKLSLLLSFVDVLATDMSVVIKALQSEFKDFEDAIQNYTAESSGVIDVIITRNVKDFKKSSIGVMTPETYLKTRVLISPPPHQ